jgi:23S rRNA pseudouridine1911/1915/1917 synthase
MSAQKGRDLVPVGDPRVVVENEDFMILDKPAHLLCHPTRLDGQASLITWLRASRSDEYLTLLNRLDRETSGLCIVAKSHAAANSINRLIERRMIEKDYLVIVWGEMKWDYLEIDAKLREIGVTSDNPVRIKQGVAQEGTEAHTKVWRLATNHGFSLLRAQPKTGRLHQIRVHLATIGLPVVGDKIYGPDASLFLKFIDQGWTEEHESRLLLPRHALHASQLRFNWQGQPFTAESPLPADLQAFWDKTNKT